MNEDASAISIDRDDGRILIGILASLEGLISAGRIEPPEVRYFRRRMAKDGAIAAAEETEGSGTVDVEAGLGELIVRIRRSLGEKW